MSALRSPIALAHLACAAVLASALFAKLAWLRSASPLWLAGDALALAALFFVGYRLGGLLVWRRARDRVRVLEARELELELQVEHLQDALLAGTRGDARRAPPSGAWRRPSA